MVSYAQTGGWNTCFMIIYLRNLPLVNVPDSPFIGERPLDLLLTWERLWLLESVSDFWSFYPCICKWLVSIPREDNQLSTAMYWQTVAINLQFVHFNVFATGSYRQQRISKWFLSICTLFICLSWQVVLSICAIYWQNVATKLQPVCFLVGK